MTGRKLHRLMNSTQDESKEFTPKYIELLRVKPKQTWWTEPTKMTAHLQGRQSEWQGLFQRGWEARENDTSQKWDVKRTVARKVYIPSKCHSRVGGQGHPQVKTNQCYWRTAKKKFSKPIRKLWQKSLPLEKKGRQDIYKCQYSIFCEYIKSYFMVETKTIELSVW